MVRTAWKPCGRGDGAQDTAEAVFLPPGIVDVAAVCWGLAWRTALRAGERRGLSARAAFARAAPLAADLGARYGDSGAGLRLLLAGASGAWRTWMWPRPSSRWRRSRTATTAASP